MDFKAILRTFLKIILPLAFGCLLLWYLYSKMDIGEIWNVIRKGVRYEIILFSLLFGLGANIVRGLRWGLLIRSLGDKVKTCNVIYAVLGNYAVNLVLPRVGEVWRCGMITKYDKIPFTRLLGTLLIDRVSDTIMVGLITMSIIIFNFDFLCEEPCVAGWFSVHVQLDMDLCGRRNFYCRNLVYIHIYE